MVQGLHPCYAKIYGKSTLSDHFYLIIQTCLGLQTWTFYFLPQCWKNQITSTFKNFGWALLGITAWIPPIGNKSAPQWHSACKQIVEVDSWQTIWYLFAFIGCEMAHSQCFESESINRKKSLYIRMSTEETYKVFGDQEALVTALAWTIVAPCLSCLIQYCRQMGSQNASTRLWVDAWPKCAMMTTQTGMSRLKAAEWQGDPCCTATHKGGHQPVPSGCISRSTCCNTHLPLAFPYPFTLVHTDTWMTCCSWMQATHRCQHDIRHAWKEYTVPSPGGSGVAAWPTTWICVSGHT